MESPIPIAIIGAGIFARETVAPAMRVLGDQFEVRAVLSRSRESGEKLAQDFLPKTLDVYVDGELDRLLARTDIVAVAVLVPIDIMPTVVEACLRAGKHVLSEKPASFDVASGLRLLALHNEPPHSGLVWGVAENWRFETAFVEAQRLVQQFGPVITSQMTSFAPMNAASKFFHTQWRKNPQFHGGYMLDGGVHFIAALRMVTGQEVVRVSASARSTTEALPSPDTANILAWLSDGSASSVTICFAGMQRLFVFRVVCEGGYVEIERGVENHVHGYWLGVKPNSCQHLARVFYPFAGVPLELTAFARNVRGGAPVEPLPRGVLPSKAGIETLTTEPIEDPPQHLLRTGTPEVDVRGLSPLEAVRDVAVIEAVLESAATNGAVVTVKAV